MEYYEVCPIVENDEGYLVESCRECIGKEVGESRIVDTFSIYESQKTKVSCFYCGKNVFAKTRD